MYLQLILGIALLILLVWLAIKVVKLVVRVFLALCFILVVCVGVLAVLYAADLRDIDTLLQNDAFRFVRVDSLASVRSSSYQAQTELLIVDDRFVQRNFYLVVNGSLVRGDDLLSYLAALNETQGAEELQKMKSQISLSALANPENQDYILLPERIFTSIHEKFPVWALSFLNFLVLPEEKVS